MIRAPSDRRRSRPGSIRIRTTAAAALVVGVALLSGSVAMARFVEGSLAAAERDQAEVRAEQIAASGLAEAGGPIPVSGPDDEFVQVVRDGEVAASSANVRGRPALAHPRPGAWQRLETVPFTDGPFIAVAVRSGGAQPNLVVVGRSIDDAVEARNTVVRALLVGVPLLLALIWLVTWTIVGRALRPVDDMRGDVDRITADELHRRVPDPGGTDEISRLAATMNRMLDRLERSQELQRRFVSDASHELRSPVASIRQHAEVAKEHPEAASVAGLSQVVLAEAARMQRLVDDLLVLARLDERAQPRSGEEVDLDDVVLSEAGRLRAATTFEVDMTNVSAGRTIGDRAHLDRLVRNLTDNAAHHARARIALGLAVSDGSVLLTVDDDGPGIRPEDRDRVFGRFQRVDGARDRSTGGSGLGLAISREIAAAHGGEVRLLDGPLGGLRVEVRLPSAAEPPGGPR